MLFKLQVDLVSLPLSMGEFGSREYSREGLTLIIEDLTIALYFKASKTSDIPVGNSHEEP